MDSNHRSEDATDLQSAPIGHSGTLPYLIVMNASKRALNNNSRRTQFCQAFLVKLFCGFSKAHLWLIEKRKTRFCVSFLELVDGFEPPTC